MRGIEDRGARLDGGEMQPGTTTMHNLEFFAHATDEELVGRNCALSPYEKKEIPRIEDATELIADASPDSTYAVTKRFFDNAKKSILIGIYDFTAGYVKELLLAAMRRGVHVSLMLDLDGRTGEDELFEELVKYGCHGVPAPSCASARAHYFSSSHEKVIVVDDKWTLVQSGNYSDSSIPLNENEADPDSFAPGNRDTGIAVRSKSLARFFNDLLRSDMKLEVDGTVAEESAHGAFEELALLEEAPAKQPPQLFKSSRFKLPPRSPILPVVSPENYLETVLPLIDSAKESICIEQQYIRGSQPAVQQLLEAIARAKHDRGAEPRVILAQPFPGQRFDKEAQTIRDLEQYGLKLGKNVRILNPRHFVHCHNKLVVVDSGRVLVSSQNWSDAALLKNREAGLLLNHRPVAKYFQTIFDADWKAGVPKIEERSRHHAPPEELVRGGFVRLNFGDYAEV